MALPACSFPIQIINSHGVFNVTKLNRLVKEAKLKECGASYTVVSIIGPQSSGKSTLLNHLFRTNFKEMDFNDGKSQTTQGIWMARAGGIEPCTLVMDLEGSDGRERGEDDTKFERQSAAFALAISDIVLINMWCNDIGRVQAANTPLLRTVFQVVARIINPRRTTLMFVIRDKSRSPLEKLEAILREDIQKIWDSVSSSRAHQGTVLSDFFDVKVVALPSFETNEWLFKEEVASLGRRFSQSMAPSVLAWNTQGKVPAAGFSINAQQIWQRISENKDLDLPSLTVMVSTIRCEEISQEKFHSFLQNKDWRRLDEAARLGPVPDFRRELTSIINVCLSGFEEETVHFAEDVRISKKRLLDEKLLNLVEPAFQYVLGHLRSENLCKFKEEFAKALAGGGSFSDAARNCTQLYLVRFNEACAGAAVERAKWDTSRARENLRLDMDAHVKSQQSDRLSKLTKAHEAKLYDALAGPVEELFQKADDQTWPSVRNLLRRESKCAISGFSVALSGFDIDERVREKMLANLEDNAKGVVEKKAGELAKRVLMLMKERFSKLFMYDNNSNPRTWTKDDDIEAISKDAYSAALKLLSAISVVQLDEKTYDTEMERSRVLLTPAEKSFLWEQFLKETEGIVTLAISTQEKNKGNSKWILAVLKRIGSILAVVASFILQIVVSYVSSN